MGRRKITIKQIVDPKLRHITFNKRKNGLIKKAAELSLLCNVNMLLVFEDNNGNLIQFSRNKIPNIPAFFQECRYNNIMEFCAKDYPTFFKVNHYKKNKDKDQESYDGEDIEFSSENISKSLSLSQNPQSKKKLGKRDRTSASSNIKEEDQENLVIYQSGSEESEDDDDLEISVYQEPSQRGTPPNQTQNKNSVKSKPSKLHKTEEKSRPKNESQTNGNDQETHGNQKESFQIYKESSQRRIERNSDYQPQLQFNNFDRQDQNNQSFRFYPNENGTMNTSNVSNNGFMNNNAFLANGYPSNPTNFPNNKNIIPRGFANLGMPNMGAVNPIVNMSNMANMSNMGNISAMGKEDSFNPIFKGFPSIGFAIGGPNPFITKPNQKPEIDDKLIDSAMMKYLGSGANGYCNQKMYSMRLDGKNDECDTMIHYRGKHDIEGVGYDNDNDGNDVPSFARGDYNPMPPNMPSAYFSSKKFNFDGYFSNFEEDRFNEYSDSKKKMKQMN